MQIPRLKSCCCGCCSLDLGAKIIAILGIVFAPVCVGFGGSPMQALWPYVVFFNYCWFGWNGVALVVSCLLLYGAIKRKRLFLLPWLVITIINVAIACLAIPANIGWLIFQIIHFQDYRSHLYTVLGIFVVLSVVFMGLTIYFSLIVYAFYKALKEEEEEVAATTEPYTIPLPQSLVTSQHTKQDLPPPYAGRM